MTRGCCCKGCDAERARNYRRQHGEKIRAAARARYAEDPDRFKARTRAYFAANTEAMKRAQVEYEKTPKCRAYRIAYDRIRDARVSASTPVWVKPAAFAPLYAAARKATEVMGEPHHVDHIIPIRHPLVCGLNVPWNLRVLPAMDNHEKGNKLHQWRGVAPCQL